MYYLVRKSSNLQNWDQAETIDKGENASTLEGKLEQLQENDSDSTYILIDSEGTDIHSGEEYPELVA